MKRGRIFLRFKSFNLSEFLPLLNFHFPLLFIAVGATKRKKEKPHVESEEGRKSENFSLERKEKNISANVVSMLFLGLVKQ